MQFEPKTEAQIEKESRERLLIPEGYCYFVVADATDEISKSGNQMIKLVLQVESVTGQKAKIWDYLLPQFAMKIKHFCDITENQNLYNTGTLTADDCIPAEGWCHVGIQKGKGDYPDRNCILDYVTQAEAMAGDASAPAKSVPVTAKADEKLDDDIPF